MIQPPRSLSFSSFTAVLFPSVSDCGQTISPSVIICVRKTGDCGGISDPAADSRIKTAFRYSFDLTNPNPNPVFNNLILSMSDERGAAPLTTTFAYSTDGDGNLIATITESAGATTVFRFLLNGNLRDITDASNKKTSLTYRSDNLLATITDPTGVSAVFAAYTNSGYVTQIQIKDADGNLRRTYLGTYDSRHRLRSVTVRASGQPDIVTQLGYDKNNNLSSVIDAELHATGFTYNHNHRITTITDAARKETNLGYSAPGCPSCGGADKLNSVQDARLQTTTYSYNKLGHLEYETDPLGKKYHYTRYPSGALKARYDAATTPEKLLVSYFYDPEDRLVRKQYSDGTPDITYTYDANGRLATAANGAISYTLSYYPSGNNKGKLQSITDNSGRQISYDDYTILGQRTQVTILKGDPDARTLTYRYDGANRPWKITSGAGTFTYGYDNLGRRQTTSYPSGVSATYNYDDLDRLTGLSHANGATAIAFATYGSYDKTDNVKSITTKTGTTSYDYDPLYRLIRAATPNGTENYGYDEVGNRLTGPGPKDTRYNYNAANQATQGAIYGHDFDNAGNQTTRTTTNPDKSWNLTWDYDNQLIRSEQTKGQEKRTLTFKYDPFGRRIEKKLTTVIRGITKTSTWTYIYDGDDIALEIYTDPNGTTEKTFYTQGAGIDEHLALERNGNFYYYHSDALGSITAITDQNGSVVQSYDYDSFGVPKQSTSFRNGYLYTGREWDRETQLYYYRARYYDPLEGRFISKDPIGWEHYPFLTLPVRRFLAI